MTRSSTRRAAALLALGIAVLLCTAMPAGAKEGKGAGGDGGGGKVDKPAKHDTATSVVTAPAPTARRSTGSGTATTVARSSGTVAPRASGSSGTSGSSGSSGSTSGSSGGTAGATSSGSSASTGSSGSEAGTPAPVAPAVAVPPAATPIQRTSSRRDPGVNRYGLAFLVVLVGAGFVFSRGVAKSWRAAPARGRRFA